MSKKKRKCNDCCCEKMCDSCCCETPCCCNNNNSYGGTGGLLGGCGGGGLAPIIFLSLACGSGLLNCGSSYLIILLFILFGGCFFNAGCNGAGNSCCC